MGVSVDGWISLSPVMNWWLVQGWPALLGGAGIGSSPVTNNRIIGTKWMDVCIKYFMKQLILSDGNIKYCEKDIFCFLSSYATAKHLLPQSQLLFIISKRWFFFFSRSRLSFTTRPAEGSIALSGFIRWKAAR